MTFALERDQAPATPRELTVMPLSHARMASALLLPLLLLSVSRFELIDDAYITVRYARNLARGEGLVYNAGEHVEGMTNLLWTLLLAIPARLGLPLDVAAVALGVCFALLALIWTARLSRLLGAGPAPTYGALLILGLNPHFWFTVSNGLEAGLFAFLLVAALESVLARRTPAVIGVLAGLLFLTRPETGVIAVLCTLYLAFAEDGAFRAADGVRTRRALSALAAFIAIAAAVTVFRLAYYGAWLPNSITAKAVPLSDLKLVATNLGRGTIYLARFGISCFSLAFGALLAVWLAPSPPVWLLASVVASELPSILLNGGDWMPHYRLLAMFAPVLAALLAVALEALTRARAPDSPRRALATNVSALLAAAALLTLTWNVWHLPPHVQPGLPGILQCYRAIGEPLIPVLQRGDVVAAEAPGLIGYELPDIYMHDPLGLADAWVARHGSYRPRIGKVDYAYTYATIHPALFLAHQDDIWLERFEEAGGERFAREYTAYFVDPPPPCAPHTDARMVLAVRNDLLERVHPALADLRLTPFQRVALDGSSAPNAAGTGAAGARR